MIAKKNKNKIYRSENLSYLDVSTKISKLPKNKVISLFSGAGGFDVGLESAGFETAACVEIDTDCRATLAFNRPNWKLLDDTSGGRIAGDINEISAEEVLKAARLRKGDAALVVGGAPCQSFSNIGKRDGIDSATNGKLYLEFLRIVEGVAPQAVIFENVSGITQNKHGEVVETLASVLHGLGYGVSSAILNAADYGVPQRRARFILIAIKGVSNPAFPLPTNFKNEESWNQFTSTLNPKPANVPANWKTLGEALSQVSGNSQRTDYALMNISDVVKNRMTFIKQGENFHVLPMELRPNCWKHGKHQGTDTFGRMKLNEPALTIRTAAYNPMKGKYIHPSEDRGYSTHDMAAIQGFPIDWVFKCAGREKITLVSGGKQIGNAVPPPLAEALGKAIKIQLLSGVKIDSHISAAAESELISKTASTAA
jgi:DNA (cytosine-5)-methyltransferase 1